MNSRIKHFAGEAGLWAPVLGLNVAGLLCLYSVAGQAGAPLAESVFYKQIIWCVSGFITMFMVFLLPESIFSRWTTVFIVYGGTLLALIAVMFFSSGTGPVHRWIEIGTVRFQPSEPAKAALILALAGLFARGLYTRISGWVWPASIVLTAIPALLILSEPDMGTALVLCVIFLGMAYSAGMPGITLGLLFLPVLAFLAAFHPVSLIVFFLLLLAILIRIRCKWWLITLLLLGCIAIAYFTPALWDQIEPYQQQRLQVFLGLKSDPHGAAYQVIQSKVAIGSGGLFGKGFLQGTQSQLRFLPEQHTDFIVSVVGEEFGFIGIFVIMCLYYMIIRRMFAVLKTVIRSFSRFVIAGVLTLVVFQVIVNTAMAVGLLPVTGLPLPFVSYGGSSMITFMALIGLVLNISSRRYDYSGT